MIPAKAVLALASWSGPRIAACAATLLMSHPGAGGPGLQAQQGGNAAPVGATSWDLVRSVGQHRQWQPYATAGVGFDRITAGHEMGIGGSAGVHRAHGNPVVGFLGFNAEVYAGRVGNALDGGGRAAITTPAFLLHAGMDWNARLRRTDFVTGFTVPLKRGGWPSPGSQLRAEWFPTRNHSSNVAFVFPLAQPLAGRTRPRTTGVALPRGAAPAPPALPHDLELRAALRDARTHMVQLTSILTFFWLVEDRHLRHRSAVREWRDILTDFAAEFFPSTSVASRYDHEAEAYHAALDRAFGIAAGAPEDGRVLADRARGDMLREVILPHNRTIARYREGGTLFGLGMRARASFAVHVSSGGLADSARSRDVLAVFDRWLLDLEELRARIDRTTSDPRFNWLPLGLVLRPEAHRTGSQVDSIIAMGMGEPFRTGNEVFTIDGPQFQRELWRSLAETREYHVLWIHDYRGRNRAGDPDHLGFETSLVYPRTLRDAILGYDRTGRLPVYMIVMDQFFYEQNDGRRWMTLLERPLSHRPQLGARFAWMEESIAAVQDSLREAVRTSVRFRAERASLGAAWVDGRVKVHVSITNPSDFTFRSPRIFGPAFGADNLARDHRKLIIRDLDESDPGAGELILSGVGIGDHYASATWDDRAMIIRGPAAAPVLAQLREVFERHQLGGEAMPLALRSRMRRGDYDRKVAQLEAAGATARVLQAHNETGWDAKDATFIQMLLYDLAPAGTLLFVPDGLWTSYQWTAQLVAAALRGCHVYIVAPAFDNAPSRDFPQMSVMQELVTRLALVEEVMGDIIRSGGGDLRIGFLARTESLDDHAATLGGIARTWHEHEFIRTRVPLSAEALDVIAAAATRASGVPASTPLVPDVRPRPAQLHRKTQWILGGDALRAVASAPELPVFLERTLEPGGVMMWSSTVTGVAADSARRAGIRELLEIHASSRGDRDDVLYFMSGSINKNIRSMTLDAEVLGVVSGEWVLESLVDLLQFAGSVTWISSVEEVERYLPPYGVVLRLMARRLHRIL